MSRLFSSTTPHSPVEEEMPKRRHYFSRSDEEIQDEMDRTALSYRVGWPQLPPLPLQTIVSGARNAVKDGYEVIESIQTILNAQRVQFLDVYFAFRVPRDADLCDKREYLTLVVHVDTLKYNSLSLSVVAIRQQLKQYEATKDVFIELIDYRAVDGLCNFLIRHQETQLLESWPEISNMVVGELRAKNAQWLSIELAHRGLLESKCAATVVITSASASESAWQDDIIPALRTRLRSYTPSLGVELLCRSTLLNVTRTEAISSSSYNQEIMMGASIRISGDEKHAGTVGGFVTLEDGRKFGLTSHYVIRGTRINDILEKENTKMLRPGHVGFVEEPHILQSPADRDHKHYMDTLADKMTAWELQAEIGNEIAPSELLNIKAAMDTASMGTREFGSLFASSGFRTIDQAEYQTPSPRRFLLDWALLSIGSTRTSHNGLPRMNIRLDGAVSSMVSGQLCDTWTPLGEGILNVKRYDVDVVKYGRTTELTFGSVNPAITLINPSQDSSWKELGEKYGFSSTDTAYCYSIVKRGKRDFVDAGDSGSIVLHDSSGTWLGLLYGESGSGSGLMIPMNMVFDDIKRVTGCGVIEPKLDMTPAGA